MKVHGYAPSGLREIVAICQSQIYDEFEVPSQTHTARDVREHARLTHTMRSRREEISMVPMTDEDLELIAPVAVSLLEENANSEDLEEMRLQTIRDNVHLLDEGEQTVVLAMIMGLPNWRIARKMHTSVGAVKEKQLSAFSRLNAAIHGVGNTQIH
jgi:DNA-directed RNA polymerase specialized sigma24 family protein